MFTFIFSSFRWVIPKELHLNTKRKQYLIKLRLYSLRNYLRMLFVMRTFFCEWWKHYDESFKTFKLINCFSDRWQVIVKLTKVKFPCINSWNPAKLFQKQVTWRISVRTHTPEEQISHFEMSPGQILSVWWNCRTAQRKCFISFRWLDFLTHFNVPYSLFNIINSFHKPSFKTHQ